MRAIDTNVLVRLITRDDLKQATAADLFVQNGAWVSHLALVEATWVLSSVYDRTPSEIATVIEMLLDHQHLAIQDADIVRAALAHFCRKPRIGFSDCLLLEVARQAGHVPLGTFDRDLGRLPGAERVRAVDSV